MACAELVSYTLFLSCYLFSCAKSGPLTGLLSNRSGTFLNNLSRSYTGSVCVQPIKIYETEYGVQHIHEGEFIAKFPLIPGHETVGVVAAKGKVRLFPAMSETRECAKRQL